MIAMWYTDVCMGRPSNRMNAAERELLARGAGYGVTGLTEEIVRSCCVSRQVRLARYVPGEASEFVGFAQAQIATCSEDEGLRV